MRELKLIFQCPVLQLCTFMLTMTNNRHSRTKRLYKSWIELAWMPYFVLLPIVTLISQTMLEFTQRCINVTKTLQLVILHGVWHFHQSICDGSFVEASRTLRHMVFVASGIFSAYPTPKGTCAQYSHDWQMCGHGFCQGL